MIITYQSIIIASWMALIGVWAVSAFNVKRDIRGGYASIWRQYWLWRIVIVAALFIFVAIRIKTSTAHFTNFDAIYDHSAFAQIIALPLALGWIAALITVIGVAFAIWARFSLGRNWSPRPAVKEKHELVTTGPYAYVRHPIYTGFTAAALGSLLTGTFFGIVVFIIACAIFLSRIKKEESIMLELFPNEYPAYQKRTKRLIPFVW